MNVQTWQRHTPTSRSHAARRSLLTFQITIPRGEEQTVLRIVTHVRLGCHLQSRKVLENINVSRPCGISTIMVYDVQNRVPINGHFPKHYEYLKSCPFRLDCMLDLGERYACCSATLPRTQPNLLSFPNSTGQEPLLKPLLYSAVKGPWWLLVCRCNAKLAYCPLEVPTGKQKGRGRSRAEIKGGSTTKELALC